MTSVASCLSCDLNFGSDANSFVEHMSEKHADDEIQCTICDKRFTSGLDYSMHYIYQHNDRGDQSRDISSNGELYECEFCRFSCGDCEQMAEHFTKFHDDSYEAASSTCSASSSSTARTIPKKCPKNGGTSHDATAGMGVGRCPVCGECLEAALLNEHVNFHFDNMDGKDSDDFRLAQKLAQEDREQRKRVEEKAFSDLQKQYGMDESGSYKQQGITAYEDAYNKGRITLSQLYDEKHRLNVQLNEGIEDPTYGIKGLVEHIHELSRRCVDILDTYVCTVVDFYGHSPADVGFGCGYRNIQMMISSLKHHEPYKKALYGNSQVVIPSIPKIQRLIETAWENGFDPVGKEQLNGRLINTKKWIGATEAAVLFSHFKFRVGVVDFWSPSGPNSTHPAMLKWVYEYFKERRSFTPPLYFQHQGHSRTIIGVERTRSGYFNLLLFDPMISRSKMQQFYRSNDMNDLKMIRRTSKDLQQTQFQIVQIKGLIQSDEEYEFYKGQMDVTKIPKQDPK